MDDIFIDQEFRSLIPTLQPEEYAELERSLIAEGNRVPIDTWKGYIIDGHNRYDICQKHNIPLKPANKITLVSREDVLLWIIRNQFGRRNLSLYQRSVLALRLEDIISKKAKEKQEIEGKKLGGNPTLKQKSAEGSIDTRQELAKIAHVSHDTIAKVKKIEQSATIDQKAKLNTGATTINRVYNQIRRDSKEWQMPEAKPEAKANIILYHSRMEDVLPSLGQFDLIVADPPYNRTRWGWDDFKQSGFLDNTRTWLSLCKSALKPSYNLFWFCSPHFSADIELIFRELELPLQSRIVWHRRNMSMGSDSKTKFIDTWEMVLHSGNRLLNFNGSWDSSRFDVQIFAAPQSNFTDAKVHPTQKPIELMRVLINYGSFPGDRILDPFAGSGVSGAVSGSRSCVLIEQSEDYAEYIRARFQL